MGELIIKQQVFLGALAKNNGEIGQREALAALEDIRATDPQKGDGDRLRGDIQQQLMTLSSIVPVVAPDREKGERPNP